MDINSGTQEGVGQNKRILCFLCAVGSSNVIVLCYVWDLALDGRELEFLSSSSPLEAAFGSPWASTLCLQPWNETTLPGASCAFL